MDCADVKRLRCDQFGEPAALRSGKGKIQPVGDATFEHREMFRQRDDRLHHVQIMDPRGIQFCQRACEKVRLLLIVALECHAVAGLDDRFQQLRRTFRRTELFRLRRKPWRLARGARCDCVGTGLT